MYRKTFKFGERKYIPNSLLALVFWTGHKKKGTGTGNEEDKENLHFICNI